MFGGCFTLYSALYLDYINEDLCNYLIKTIDRLPGKN